MLYRSRYLTALSLQWFFVFHPVLDYCYRSNNNIIITHYNINIIIVTCRL